MIKTTLALCLIGIALAQDPHANNHGNHNPHTDHGHDQCATDGAACTCHDGTTGLCVDEHGHKKCHCHDSTINTFEHQNCTTDADCATNEPCDHGTPHCNTHAHPPHCLCNHHGVKRAECGDDSDCTAQCSHHPPGFCEHGHCNCHGKRSAKRAECDDDADCAPQCSHHPPGFCNHGHCNCHGKRSARAAPNCHADTCNQQCHNKGASHGFCDVHNHCQCVH